ncbi:FtsW/RodA/SpoVE family cell cycle protein [Bellilinea sp.]|jgi:rod shape determining protein RodA|uniref:FtsW/RodA/SpoVE family cell cycle protein n=1 Tax=Bellilinea sp. TaxID=2838785 RepID=UPI002ADD3B10|nr:FtsW/RodA/SpoVE family cell cycle protein [Bellilinea sp.]
MLRREIWRHFDYWLFGAVLILSVFGIVMIRSAIAGNQELAGSVQSQTIYVALGMGIILVVASINYRTWSSLSRLMYIFGVVMLIGINIIGEAAFGSTRWFRAGVINIQPSELAKIIMIIVLADYFSRTAGQPKNLIWIGKSALMTFGMVVWILLQPNLSTSIVVIVIWFALLWISGLPTRYMIIFGVAGILIFAALVGLLAAGVDVPFIEPYQVNRIVNFLFPDPNARHGETYNIEQALITIGNGGLFGKGYGAGTQVQLRFLKVRHTDFIFSAMAEEFGFIGTTMIIGLLVFVVIRCLRVAQKASDTFGSLIAYGIAILIFFQMAVNIGVNLNVLPVTGLTLPFISYGGSSLISLVLGIGLVESVAAHSQTLDF